MFYNEFQIVEADTLLSDQGEPCARSQGCDHTLGFKHWVSPQKPESLYCSMDCADKDLEALKMCVIWNKLNNSTDAAVAPYWGQAPVLFEGATWYRVWSGNDYPYTGDEWWDGVLECREGEEPRLDDLFFAPLAVNRIMFQKCDNGTSDR